MLKLIKSEVKWSDRRKKKFEQLGASRKTFSSHSRVRVKFCETKEEVDKYVPVEVLWQRKIERVKEYGSGRIAE